MKIKIIILFVILTIVSITTCCISTNQSSVSHNKAYSDEEKSTDHDIDEVQKSNKEDAYWFDEEPMDEASVYGDDVSEIIVEKSMPINLPSNHIRPSSIEPLNSRGSNSSSRYNNGTLAFKIDSIFIINVASRVEARIVKSLDTTVTTRMIQMFHHTTNGEVRQRTISVDNVMDMELYSFDADAFSINEMTSGNQLVDSTTIAHWIWSVKPLMMGEQGLIIKAIIKKNGANVERIVFDEKISVVSKPKKIYTTSIEIDSIFIKDGINIIKYTMEECDGCVDGIYWGNNGVVKLVIDNEEDFVIDYDDNVFVDKVYQEYKWRITPTEKGSVEFSIILENDNERIVLHEGEILVKNNIRGLFKTYVTDMLGLWGFLLTFLIIPIIVWYRKKKKKKKEGS